MLRRSPFARATTSVALAAAVLSSVALAPTAGAQSAAQLPGFNAGSLESTPVGLPGIESAPLPSLQVAGLDLPIFTVPTIAPARPAPEYGKVGIFPTDGETVGVAQPVMFTFDKPITDRAKAEATLGVRTAPALDGKFYWISDTEVRWRPLEFYPPNTTVTVYAGGRQQSFRTGDAVVTTYDDNTKMMTTTRNGEVVREMRASSGRPQYATHNGTYYTGWRAREVQMDSSTWGLARDAGGYDTTVNDGVRLSYDGIFVHSAPWSVADQGVRNVSHGCFNLSPEDARWFYENTRNGDPVIVKNTLGREFGAFDGQGDWNY
ncbi:MAG TPA: L,D-transpeptidase [Dietzia timorensis]|uniref:L,D-transpeptidase n=1 Tax=Dietzia timorensis TaxID=499555 RepID=A0A921F4Q7_9ACTN|nr:L,D-transpeptidase [Dietzia timorensis]HJE91215.1 L,D-transpeptidase [Dietzia timorensis]